MKNAKNKQVKRFVVDSVGTAVFWTIIYIPIFILTSRSFDIALIGIGSAAVVEIAFGGLFGKFLDRFRRILL